MALRDVIARLAVNLSLETAAFERGATKSEKRMNQMRGKFAKLGASFKVGAAGIAAAAVGINKVFGDLATKSKEIGNAAQVAGEGFEEFQRQAYAAKTVGVEFDKLGDIFKDVRDRIGDFAQTGGGPMADFFENIAPKVGVTAKQFEGLGGKDALQLYYNSLKQANLSQEDMVFYLEAMASDTTALIPLLEKGGKAFDEIGSKASIITDEQRDKLKRYNDAMLQMENALQRITLALVDSGLIDRFADFAEGLAAVAEGFSGVTKAANATDAELTKNEGARNFGRQLRSLNDTMQEFVDDFDAYNERNAAAARAFWGSIGDGLKTLGAKIGQVNAQIAGFFQNISDTVDRLASRIHEALVGRLNRTWKAVTDKVKQVEQGFAWLYDRVVGNSWIPDMVDEVGQHMAKLDALMVDPARKATEDTNQAFRDLAYDVGSLLDRLFPQAARLRELRSELKTIDDGLAAGQISPEIANEARFRLGREYRGDDGYELPDSMRVGPIGNSTPVEIKQIETGLDRILRKGRELGETIRNVAADAFAELGYQLKGVLVGAQNLGDALKNILASLADMAFNMAWRSLGQGLSLPGFAAGTMSAPRGLAWVGERGPELVNFRGGERVYNNRDSMAMAGGGGTSVTVHQKVVTPDANSFRRSERQITRGLSRRLGQ